MFLILAAAPVVLLLGQLAEPPPLPVTRAQIVGDWAEMWMGDRGQRVFRKDGTCTWSSEYDRAWHGSWWLERDGTLIVHERGPAGTDMEWKCKLHPLRVRRIQSGGGFTTRMDTAGEPIEMSLPWRGTGGKLVLTRDRPGS